MTPTVLDHVPDRLLSLPATALHAHLNGPTLIHLPGRQTQPLVVSVLQHGNETSGWEALRRLLKGRYQRDPLPRSLIIYIGNPQAAAVNVRHLDHQPDLNRCWPGSTLAPTPWHRLMAAITDHIKQCQPMASIDIHNNTGRNPHYAAVNRLEPEHLSLACEFSRSVVFFTEPRGVQSQAFGQFCPAVTLECGLAQEAGGADHAMAYLDTMLHCEALSTAFPSPGELELFQTQATLKLDPAARFCIGPDTAHSPPTPDVVFSQDLDTHNFEELPLGFCLATTKSDHPKPLIAYGPNDKDVSARYLEQGDGHIRTTRAVTPAMMTLDAFAIRHDCLCYLMERIQISELKTGARAIQAGMTLPEAEAESS
ncbi:MAG: M14 family metallopeptidase [Wenzhouxiangella sp.]|nr:M14 family metallopeptidase [Wenzhouxiangella sp.]